MSLLDHSRFSLKSSCELKEVPEELKTSVFNKGKKEDPGNYRMVSFTLILEDISKPIEKVWSPSHQEGDCE
ncbi:mitochondrial enolase superfamily member 1 [Grus japonensis]|uniref:Mitochondrial enolase superfamily member 1 n=1 Tax=Grus japonensis TaxID=30415 RepID=A0ABC9VSM9_GRUJA